MLQFLIFKNFPVFSTIFCITFKSTFDFQHQLVHCSQDTQDIHMRIMFGQIILVIIYAQTVKEKKKTFKAVLRRIMADHADFTGLLDNEISS